MLLPLKQVVLMPDFSETLVVGISSTALFDLREASRVFEEEGIDAYRKYMLKRESETLLPGTGFPLVKALSRLNEHSPPGQPLVDVRVMSQNSPETGLPISNSVKHYGLAVSRFIFTGGEPVSDYAAALGLDLYLSTNQLDVQQLIDADVCAAALLYPPPHGHKPSETQVRIALDGDAVVFSDESEALYKAKGLEAFFKQESDAANSPMNPGPFYRFLLKLAKLQKRLPERIEYNNIRLAIVTARNAPADQRVITTLRAWNLYVDAAFFLGGLPKAPVLQAFRPHIFFDDQPVHLDAASKSVPSAQVPYKTSSPLHKPEPAENTRAAGSEIPLRTSPADHAGANLPVEDQVPDPHLTS